MSSSLEWMGTTLWQASGWKSSADKVLTQKGSTKGHVKYLLVALEG